MYVSTEVLSSGAVPGLFSELRDLLKGQDIKEISVRKPELTEEMKEAVMDSECLVFAFPLYVDSVLLTDGCAAADGKLFPGT